MKQTYESVVLDPLSKTTTYLDDVRQDVAHIVVRYSSYVDPNEQGPSVLNVFYGIGDMYDNLTDFIEIMDERLPVGFIPIGDDPSGNVIGIGTNKPYYDKIYFWDHEQEPEDPNSMSNMYFLANDIDEFLSNLYEEPEE